MSVETLDGGALWSCFQQHCATYDAGESLTACAADCQCNNAVLSALACTVDAGGPSAPMSAQMSCFMTAAGNGGAMALAVIGGCILINNGVCNAPPAEGGTGDGGSGDAASDATGQ
jgi:hypothetical protein